MDKQYEQYCLANQIFYDSPQQRDPRAMFPISLRHCLMAGVAPAKATGSLTSRPGPRRPRKAGRSTFRHVSITPMRSSPRYGNYCVPRGVCFKFLGSRMAVLMRNAKYASRSASGKAVTIYPADEADCERILRDLDTELSGSQGPYILSDLRYGAGPLYVRYGGFTERFCLDSRGRWYPRSRTRRVISSRPAVACFHDAGVGQVAGIPGTPSCRA